ncbi:MAG: hypothetical protein IKZ35_02835 [Clostridia bacterium]|nr:hypothetical protein [Clostridia bacterium]
MNRNDIKRIQKRKEIKQELDILSNKLLMMFTISLILGIVLIFLHSAFMGYGSHIPKVQGFVTFISTLGFILFLALLISSFIVNKKIKVSLRNWSIVSLVIGTGAFFVYPIDIVSSFFSLIGLPNKGGVLAVKLSNIMGTKAIKVILIGLVIYVIGMFIYYTVKGNKIKSK